jgi:hypothetical protein
MALLASSRMLASSARAARPLPVAARPTPVSRALRPVVAAAGAKVCTAERHSICAAAPPFLMRYCSCMRPVPIPTKPPPPATADPCPAHPVPLFAPNRFPQGAATQAPVKITIQGRRLDVSGSSGWGRDGAPTQHQHHHQQQQSQHALLARMHSIARHAPPHDAPTPPTPHPR